MAYSNLMKYARVLLEHCPKNATQIFIDYYTSRYRPKTAVVPTITPVTQGGAINAVQNLASFIPLPYRQSPAVGSPAAGGNQQLSLNEAEATEASAVAPAPEYEVPKPRTAFSFFVDHPAEFVVFLEACLQQDNIERGDKVDLYTTLFEMYLETAQGKEGIEKEAWETKAKGLIDGQDVSREIVALLSMLIRIDSHRYFQCAPTITLVKLPRWHYSCSGATGSSLRYLQIIYHRPRHCWCDQSTEKVWSRGTTAVSSRSGLLHVQP